MLVLGRRREPALFDVLSVPVLEPRPQAHQPENWLLAQTRWRLIEQVDATALSTLIESSVERGPELLGSVTDRVPFSAFEARSAAASLALVEPRSIEWHIRAGFRGNRQTRAHFELAGRNYDLPITDPRFEQRLAGLGLGDHPRAAAGIATDERVLLTVSLGEPFNFHCFKLIAAVLVLPKKGLLS